MDTSKMTEEEEAQLRFGAWISSIDSSISEAHVYADYFLAAAVGDETNWDFVRLATEYHNKALHLEQVKADAIAVREIKSKQK